MKRRLAGGTALLAVLLFLPIFFATPSFASAAEVSPALSIYDFNIQSYDVEMTISQDRKIEAKETISVVFFRSKSGIIRDFPLEGGIRYEGVSASRDGAPLEITTSLDDTAFLSVYLGQEGHYLTPKKVYTYAISYTMYVPALKEEGYLPLDVIGHDWQAEILSASVTVHLPEGLSGYQVYSGFAGSVGNADGVQSERKGNDIFLTVGETHGITLDLQFEEGVLSVAPDGIWYWVLPAGAVLLLIALAALLLSHAQRPLVRTVSFNPPEDMDPLRMGKLIDGKVDSEDVGSLVFWLASKQYLRIDLTENDEDPTLSRAAEEGKTIHPLPKDVPLHVKKFYEGLFRHGDRVRVSSLENTFYTTAEDVTAIVNASAGIPHRPLGTVFTVLLGVVAALFFGFLFLLQGFGVTAAYSYYFGFAASAVGYGVAAFGAHFAAMRRYKWKTVYCVLLTIGSMLAGFAGGLFGWLFPPAFTSSLAVFAAAACSSVAGSLAGWFALRTREYNEILGKILGFRDFILYTERDKIAKMMEIDPELYYTVLPYAQVLGVSSVWSEKFEGLALGAPAYADYAGDYFFRIAVFHSLFHSFSHVAVSRPAPKSSGSHGFGGGFGGGFSGGGFSGGGGRSF